MNQSPMNRSPTQPNATQPNATQPNATNRRPTQGLNRWTRKLHRWGALVTLIPMLIVIVSGLLLQVKKQVTWVQPATVSGVAETPQLAFEEILAIAKSHEEAEVGNWNDIDRLDVRPSKGVVKLQAKNSWELQIDLETGELLSSKYRRSDLIESLHDGSWFGDIAKLWAFLPNGLILAGLWLTGVYLWWLPHGVRRKKRRKANQKVEDDSRAV